MIDSTLMTQAISNVDVTKQISDLVNIENLSTILGITGYSIRDFKGLQGINKFKNLFIKHFPKGLKTETQDSILSDSFIEIKDYIDNHPNLDDKIFEEINKVLINGLSTEEMMTRVYIKTLKELTFIDLIILKEINNIQILQPNKYTLQNEISKQENFRAIPKEIIVISFNKLEKMSLISPHAKKIKTSENNDSYMFFTEFSEKLLKATNI